MPIRLDATRLAAAWLGRDLCIFMMTFGILADNLAGWQVHKDWGSYRLGGGDRGICLANYYAYIITAACHCEFHCKWLRQRTRLAVAMLLTLPAAAAAATVLLIALVAHWPGDWLNLSLMQNAALRRFVRNAQTHHSVQVWVSECECF